MRSSIFFTSAKNLPTHSLSRLVVQLAVLSCLTGCLKQQAVVDNCFPSDTTIDGAMSGDFFVGFTHKQDSVTHNNPSSPTIHFKGDVFSGDDALQPGYPTLGGITVYNKSVFFMEGGSINGYLTAKDNSRVTVTGGTNAGVLEADDASVVTVKGGGGNFSMHILKNATLTVTGGEVSSPAVYDKGVLKLEGGKTNGTATVGDKGIIHLRGGGAPEALMVWGNGTLNVYGTGFKKTLVDAQFENGHSSSYKLSGKLSDGTKMSDVILDVAHDTKEEHPTVRFIETASK